MAFKSVENYNKERYKNLFVLRDDGDYADVIFLYRSYQQVMVGEVHYLKSADYTGYVQCCGTGCPACARNIRVQNKLFIPLYNIREREIQFFDRTMKFETQLSRDVFSKFPDPSEFVFRITRHGVANDVNTTYSIDPVGNNKLMSYEDICKKFGLSFPEAYDSICKEVSIAEMDRMFNTPASPASGMADYTMPAYQITPRGVSAVPDVQVPPVEIPPVPVAPPVGASVDVPVPALSDYTTPVATALADYTPESVDVAPESPADGTDPEIDDVAF